MVFRAIARSAGTTKYVNFGKEQQVHVVIIK